MGLLNNKKTMDEKNLINQVAQLKEKLSKKDAQIASIQSENQQMIAKLNDKLLNTKTTKDNKIQELNIKVTKLNKINEQVKEELNKYLAKIKESNYVA